MNTIETKSTDLKRGKVKTISVGNVKGTIENRKDCISIRDHFHLKNRDCFIVDGKWTSKYFNTIAYDHYTKQYKRVKDLMKAIVDYNNGELIEDYTSKIDSDSLYFIDGRTGEKYICMNREVFNKIGLEECPNSGVYYVAGTSPVKKRQAWNKAKHKFDNVMKLSLSTARTTEAAIKIKKAYGVMSDTLKVSDNIPYTFGVEIEAANGFFPVQRALDMQLNILCERDGSLNNNNGGPEYVTGVLYGDEGFRNLYKICRELTFRHDTNPSCGVHVHVGNLNFTKQFIVMSYILAKKIEEQVYSIFPESRRAIRTDDGLQQNVYCKRLVDLTNIVKSNNEIPEEYDSTKINNLYKRIFFYLSGGKSYSSEFNEKSQHPLGRKCSYDKNSPRYTWLNFIPATFNIRGDDTYTLEFRIHSDTTSYTKIRNWILFCFAFIRYAESSDNVNAILDKNKRITIDDILTAVYTEEKANYLSQYFTSRQKHFSNKPNSLESSFVIQESYKKEFEVVTDKDINI